MNRFFNLFFFVFFLVFTNVISQETEASIGFIQFNSDATYAAGSGVSVHIDPKGVYELIDINQDNNITLVDDLTNENNNRFILELSEPGGSFVNPTILSTVYDFYTPLLNGTIPSSIANGDYKLRVRATKGVVFDSNFVRL